MTVVLADEVMGTVESVIFMAADVAFVTAKAGDSGRMSVLHSGGRIPSTLGGLCLFLFLKSFN